MQLWGKRPWNGCSCQCDSPTGFTFSSVDLTSDPKTLMIVQIATSTNSAVLPHFFSMIYIQTTTTQNMFCLFNKYQTNSKAQPKHKLVNEWGNKKDCRSFINVQMTVHINWEVDPFFECSLWHFFFVFVFVDFIKISPACKALDVALRAPRL